MPNNNTKSQEKITLGPEALIFLGAFIGLMILVVVIEKLHRGSKTYNNLNQKE